MKCDRLQFPDGTTAIVCSRGRRHRCEAPGCSSSATRQCDFPVNRPGKRSRTCDRWICEQHAKRVGADVDWCPPHARYAEEHGMSAGEQLELLRK